MRIKGAGEAFGDHPGYADQRGDTIRFFAYVRTGQGQAMRITAERLTVPQAVTWIHRRVEAFNAMPQARESGEMAVQRKTIAAHGEEFVRRVRAELPAMGQMEVDMMFSPDSHSQLAAPQDLPTGRIVSVSIDADGAVTGLRDLPLEPARESAPEEERSMQEAYHAG